MKFKITFFNNNNIYFHGIITKYTDSQIRFFYFKFNPEWFFRVGKYHEPHTDIKKEYYENMSREDILIYLKNRFDDFHKIAQL